MSFRALSMFGSCRMRLASSSVAARRLAFARVALASLRVGDCRGSGDCDISLMP